MIKYIRILLPVLFLIASCRGENIPQDAVPSVVLNALKAKYPSSNDVDWKKNGRIYEAELDINDSTEISVRIDEAGTVVMQKHDVPRSQLAPALLAAIQNQYKDFRIDDVERIEKGSAVFYQVELKSRGRKEVNSLFAEDGKEETGMAYWD